MQIDKNNHIKEKDHYFFTIRSHFLTRKSYRGLIDKADLSQEEAQKIVDEVIERGEN